MRDLQRTAHALGAGISDTYVQDVVSYRELTDALDNIQQHNNGKDLAQTHWTQSFELVTKSSFMKFLLGDSICVNSSGISRDDTIEVINAIRAKCGGLIVVDYNDLRLTLDLNGQV